MGVEENFVKTNMAAALNRLGLIRLCNTSLRSLSTSSPWTADKSSGASSGLSKKIEMETTFPRSKKMAGLITVEGAVDVATTSGVPEEHIKERYVRIYRPAKNAMQSGTHGIKRWRI